MKRKTLHNLPNLDDGKLVGKRAEVVQALRKEREPRFKKILKSMLGDIDVELSLRRDRKRYKEDLDGDQKMKKTDIKDLNIVQQTARILEGLSYDDPEDDPDAELRDDDGNIIRYAGFASEDAPDLEDYEAEDLIQSAIDKIREYGLGSGDKRFDKAIADDLETILASISRQK